MKCLYIVLLMAMFWVTEVLPLPVTGLIPVVLYPLMGVMSTNETCLCYMNDTTMMFLGSLVIAVAIENSGLHMRVALFIIRMIGCSHRRYFLFDILHVCVSLPSSLVELTAWWYNRSFFIIKFAICIMTNSEFINTRFPNEISKYFMNWIFYAIFYSAGLR